MSNDNERFDGILLSMLSHSDVGIESFFDVLFNFLSRKSDFFTGMDTATSRKMLLDSYEKYAKETDKPHSPSKDPMSTATC
uniref:Nudc_N domain-containing protein n=1 Tax=Panagrellus redivivus TaxID=6233 RepID=A0A7E4V9Z1_PANRE